MLVTRICSWVWACACWPRIRSVGQKMVPMTEEGQATRGGAGDGNTGGGGGGVGGADGGGGEGSGGVMGGEGNDGGGIDGGGRHGGEGEGGGSKGGGKEGGGGNGDGEGEGFMQMNLSSVGAGVVVRGHQRGQGGHGQRQHTVDGTGNESGSRVRARCADGWVKVWAKE